MFSVEKADAASEPGTVMVHPQNALFTTGTMVAPFGFKTVANHAVSFFADFGLVHIKALLLLKTKAGEEATQNSGVRPGSVKMVVK